jgi:hypothetical protein
MNMLILSLHILAALITTVAIIGVTISAYRKSETKLYMTMLLSFGVTAVSGIGLVFIVGGLGRFCAMMSMYVVLVMMARSYYHKQIASSSL